MILVSFLLSFILLGNEQNYLSFAPHYKPVVIVGTSQHYDLGYNTNYTYKV